MTVQEIERKRRMHKRNDAFLKCFWLVILAAIIWLFIDICFS